MKIWSGSPSPKEQQERRFTERSMHHSFDEKVIHMEGAAVSMGVISSELECVGFNSGCMMSHKLQKVNSSPAHSFCYRHSNFIHRSFAMGSYSTQKEANTIFQEKLLKEAQLQLPTSFLEAAEKVTFTGDDANPFIPTPCRLTESASALTALVATAASAIAAARYGIGYQDISVNTYVQKKVFLKSPP